MNALLHSQSGYAPENTSLRPLRAVEYDLLAQVTRRLSSTWRNRKADHPNFVAALNDNLSLWRAMALDVSGSGNLLPAPLRAQLFYLFEFTDHHTARILKNEASVEVLVDVNMAVMRGLRGEGGAK